MNVRSDTAASSDADRGGDTSVTGFELQVGESAADGLRRIALDQVDIASWHVRHLGEADVHVHEVRKATKRLRAVARLVKDELGDEAFGETNTIVRDVARELSRARSSSVQIEILGGLTDENARLADSTETLFEELSADVAKARLMVGEASFIDHLASRLEKVRAGIVDWALPQDMDPTAYGLRRTYRRGRSGMTDAYAEETSSSFHRWRKQVKYLRHQLEVLAPISRERISDLVAGLESIGAGLGLDHDLADLEAAATGSGTACAKTDHQDDLIDTIEQRRSELRADIRPLAFEIYFTKSSVFAREMSDLWGRWRDTARAVD